MSAPSHFCCSACTVLTDVQLVALTNDVIFLFEKNVRHNTVSLLDGETSLPRLAKSKHKISLEQCITVQQFHPRFRDFILRALSLVIEFFASLLSRAHDF